MKARYIKTLIHRVGLLPIIFLNLALIAWIPNAEAQVNNFETTAGKISGIVLLQADGRPAGQVLVNLRSDSAGISRRVLTDLEGRFEVQSLPPSTYEIIVEEEPGYEPSRTSAQLTGSSSELVLYLRRSKFSETHRNDYTVSCES